MNISKWVKRSAVTVAMGAGALAVMGPSTPAEAGTATATFTVSASISAACTFTTNNLAFGNYITGQSSPVYGSAGFSIICPGVSVGSPDTASFQFTTASGIFEMTAGASHIDYLLCNDAACGTQYAYNTAGPNFSVTANPQTYTLYGELTGNQTPTATGAHTQTVTAQLNF